MTDEEKYEHARVALESAVYAMLEAGATPQDVREEVDYAIESSEEIT